MLFAHSISLLPFLACALADDWIVGGAPADIADYPYVVALETGGAEICGGTIIAQDRILTAGHCVHDFTANQITIRYGTSHRVSGGYLATAKSIRAHPKYNLTTVDYDVGIVELDAPLTWGSSLPLQPVGEKLAPGTEAVVAGWGSLYTNGPQPSQLYSVSVPLVDHELCKADYPGQVTDRMTCFAGNGKDACNGDSGSGLVSDGRVVGIVSWGDGCAEPSHPGVYTDVSNEEVQSFITG